VFFFISGGTKGDRELGHHFRQKTLDGGESSLDCVVQLRELPQESFLYLGSTNFLYKSTLGSGGLTIVNAIVLLGQSLRFY
jgi:hypothetical protein